LHKNGKSGVVDRSWLAIRIVLVASVALLAACAVVEIPPGGEIDTQSPYLVQAIPDSGVVGLPQFDTIYLSFSEKMDRTSAVTWLHFFPDQRIRKTKWHGATMAEIVLEYPLPADTTIVIEIPSGMRDAHKVKNPRFRSFPIATADSLLRGSIGGVLVMGESPVADGVVELFDVPPDSLEYFQQPLLRRTITDKNGSFRFNWLPVPGGPWLLRAFVDNDGNLRPGEKEAQRLIPDTLSINWDLWQESAGVTTLYAPETPGRLIASAVPEDSWPATHFAWAEFISAADTGWVPAPADTNRTIFFPLSTEGGSLLTEVMPGSNRVFVFADVDGDSTFNAVPDSLFPPHLLPDIPVIADQDSIPDVWWYLEPHTVVENVVVLPGLDATWTVPALPDTLLPWTPPVVEDLAESLGDTLGGAFADTVGIEIPTQEEE
jgi:hypothetical protein